MTEPLPASAASTDPVTSLPFAEGDFERLLDLSPDMIAVHQDGLLVYVNAAVVRVFGGQHPGDMIGRRVLDFVHPEDRLRVLERGRRILEEGLSVPLAEERLIRPDGTVVPVEAAGAPCTFAGRPAVQVVLRDITERKRQEAMRREDAQELVRLNAELRCRNEAAEAEVAARTRELRESEERFRLLVDATFDGVLIQAGGRMLAVSDRLARMYGYSPEEVVGRTLDGFVVPEDLERVTHLVQAGAETYEATALRRDGTTFPYEVVARDCTFEGRPARIAAIRDLTETKRAERLLRESEARFRGLVDASFDGVAIHDQGAIVEANQALAEMFGYPLAELIGLSGLDVCDPAFHDLVRRHLAEGHERPYEVVGIRKDGSRIHVEMVGKRCEYQGKPMRVSAFRDITLRKRLEAELVARNAQLQELDRLKSAFVDSVTHELRTPLTSVRGFAEFLEDGIGGELAPEQHAFVGQIQEGLARLERLVDDLLDFARLDAGTFRLALAVGDLVPSLREVAGSFAPQARDRAVELRSTIPEGPLVARADVGRLGQVLSNLVANALKFTPAGGQVHVVASSEPGAIRVEVADTGPGIAPEHLPRLFDRFYQVPSAAGGSASGTGLGLAIARALVEAHGGRIGVRAEPGRGATFWFTVPSGGP